MYVDQDTFAASMKTLEFSHDFLFNSDKKCKQKNDIETALSNLVSALTSLGDLSHTTAAIFIQFLMKCRRRISSIEEKDLNAR